MGDAFRAVRSNAKYCHNKRRIYAHRAWVRECQQPPCPTKVMESQQRRFLERITSHTEASATNGGAAPVGSGIVVTVSW